jgi:ubiquinone/menaquinone biosynthesis C-methylase UbiE
MRQKQSWAKAAFLLCMFLIPTVVGAQQQTAMPPRTQDRPLQDRIATMERAQRDEWQKPDEVVKALALNNGDIVADVGAGSGYFSRRLSRAVGPSGKVYAVDVAADILAYLKERADQEGLRNIVTIVSQPDDSRLPADSVDLVFFCDTTHHIDSRVAFYRKLISAVRQHGRMAIIDYPPDSPHAPHKPEQLVPRAQVISEAEQAGFKFIKDFQFLPYHYFLMFEKK